MHQGALALLAQRLIAAGELAPELPLARWWPAFDRPETAEVTVAAVLDHRAGLPGIVTPFDPLEVYDFEAMCERVAASGPLWRPGTRQGYHSFTFGWLLGGLVQRATGATPGELLARELAEPQALDLWIRLPPAHHRRVARTCRGPLPDLDGGGAFAAAVRAGRPIQHAVVRSWGAFRDPAGDESERALAAEVPAANGVASARALALLYAPAALGSGPLGARLAGLGAHAASAAARDAVTLSPRAFNGGFEVAVAGAGDDVALPPGAFGHSGMGGSLGFADPARRLSFGYVMNRHDESGADRRAVRLVDALETALAPRPACARHA